MPFTNPQQEKFRGVRWRMRGPGNISLSSYPTIRKLLVHKGMNTIGEVRWCTM
jgi:hypothetical protein